jgi:hypothetical protein
MKYRYHCPVCIGEYVVGDGVDFKEYNEQELKAHLFYGHNRNSLINFVFEEAEDFDNNYRVIESEC